MAPCRWLPARSSVVNVAAWAGAGAVSLPRTYGRHDACERVSVWGREVMFETAKLSSRISSVYKSRGTSHRRAGFAKPR